MKATPMKLVLSLCLVTVSLLLVGCTKNRNLKITEVSTDRIEFFLDEPAGNALALSNLTFNWKSQDPGGVPLVEGSLDLSLAGTMQGRQFLVVFEDPNYMGPPVGQNFRPATPGIKVSNGFLPNYTQGTSVRMNVAGESNRHVLGVPVKDKVNDLLVFGPTPRPFLAGSINEDNTLDNVRPEGGRESVSRRFLDTSPVDNDLEADWLLKPESIGLANPL